MKKRSSPQKKRAAARRKKRLKRRQRLSVQQRLARLAKEKTWANLIATLSQFPTNLTGAVEPEPEEYPHLLKLGRSLWNATLNSQAYPQRFGRLQTRVQQQLSVTASLSLPQRLTSALSVGAAVARRESAVLWWVAPRQRCWPLAPVGCRMTLPASTPQVVTHYRGPILSHATPGSPYVVAQPTFSCSITLKQPPAKLFCQEKALTPPLSSGYPVRRWEGSNQTAPAAAVNPDLRADNPPGAEQLSSNGIKGDIEHERFVFKKHPREARSRRVTKRLRKTTDSIRKSSRPDKKPSLGRVLNRAKKQRQLGQTGGSILRIRGWSRADDTGLLMKCVKLLGRKHLGSFRWPSIRSGDGRCWLRERRAASSTDSHHPLFTLIPSAAVPGSRPPSVQPSLATVLNPDLRADNPPEAEQSSPNNKNEIRSRRIFVFKKHLQAFRPCQATEDSSDEDDELGTEQDAFDDEEEITGQTLFEAEVESPEASRDHQVGFCPSCCIDSLLQGEYPIPEGNSAEQLVGRFRLREAMSSAALQYDYSCDVCREISDRISPTLLWRFAPVVFI